MDATTTGFISKGFVFPILKSEEILQLMGELGFAMSKVELMEPHRHKERLRQMYLFLVRAGWLFVCLFACCSLLKVRVLTLHPTARCLSGQDRG